MTQISPILNSVKEPHPFNIDFLFFILGRQYLDGYCRPLPFMGGFFILQQFRLSFQLPLSGPAAAAGSEGEG